MSDLLITFNAGSSTVKIGLFEIRTMEHAHRIAKGVIDFQKHPLHLRITKGASTFDDNLAAAASDDLSAVMADTLDCLGKHFDLSQLAAAGHRIVHGGDRFEGPARINDATVDAIEALTKLAPLHQPQSLRLIRAIRSLKPTLAQSASFDTAFHRTNNDIVRRFAIPRGFYDAGIKRYGFHGLSYKFIAGALKRCAPDAARGKVVAAHLGSGASLCALDDSVSRDSSMGFSTLDGIPMATRCGTLDPGVLLHLLGPGGKSLHEMEDILYHRSGLLGVSGISADSRVLLASNEPLAREAIDLFTFRIAGEVARLTATLGGLDAIVFTAGIGENQPLIREKICDRLGWLGIALDPKANAGNAKTVSTISSRVTALVIPTDEEQVIADEALFVLNGKD
ncbi:acetate/propionate family kinase [Pseudorhodoplanes sinuspersici]|uniref:Acetate kinase n=1 Tax=Pseudorhodoplanes sinuspersici TaxID=1235591 RepID=A0A1W6ZSY8_9HYPH|nr:acetate/propionate family kinase [Pseudorhodoplanes sinuspersici]ARQ00539.1 acetate kinase [Pseudorhodoplanes sinuspersici]RKE67267.1 acetate kinase [Pseudorhodoplanes sinuspersici]